MKIEPLDGDITEKVSGNEPVSDENNRGRVYELTTAEDLDVQENDLYEVTFHISQALRALAIHFLHLFLGPLSLPISYRCFGATLCKNMQFGIRKYYVLEFLCWVWVVLVTVAAWYYEDIIEQLLALYISCGIIILIRYTLVSVKYGYFPHHIWKEMGLRVYTTVEIEKFLLVKSWNTLDLTVASEEVCMAFKRLNLEKFDCRLKFTHGLCRACHENFMDKMGLNEDNTVRVLQLSNFIMKELVISNGTNSFWLVKIMASLYSFSPILLRIYRYGISWVAMDWGQVMFIIYSVGMCFYISKKFLLYIQAGVEDFKRKILLMAQCTGLISRVDRKLLLVGKDCSPKLDINDPRTIMNWYYMRRTFLDFGKRYTLRVFLYTSLILPMSVGVIVIIILQMFNVIGVSYNYYFVPFMILIAQVITMVILMALAAVNLNEYFNVHIDVLLDHIGKVLRKKAAMPEKYEDPEKLIDTLDFVISKLEEDRVLRPIKIMGIIMDVPFILKLASIAASGAFAVVQIFYKF